jgi:RimJ/RimL family protein N-acetyltransferase
VVNDDFVRRHTVDVTVRDGGHIRLRPVLPEDKDRLVAGLQRLSPQSRYRRFLSPVNELSPRTLAYLTEIDFHDHFAWGALDLDQPDQPGVGVARYVRLADDPEAAEAAVAVVDDHQGRGIGTLLLEVLTFTAVEHGIRRLVASALADNAAVQDLLEDLGVRPRWDPEAGALVIEAPVPTDDAESRHGEVYDLLRAAARGAVQIEPPRPTAS